MFKKLGVGLGFMLMLLTIPVSGVLACSGYPYFGVSSLPTMELLVRATVIDTDDRGYNAIIRVEDYYKGEGARLLTVMRYKPALSSGAQLRGYDTSCLYSGRGHRWVKGSQGYFGLMSNGDGTYTDYNNGSAHFYVVDGFIRYEEGATEGYAIEFDEAFNILEDEFVELLLEAGERDAPIQPVDTFVTTYPLMRFLNVTTTSGSRYQINPDRSVLRLPDDSPLAISPDGAHVAFRVDDKISFQYIWTDFAYGEDFAQRFETPADATAAIDALQVEGEAVRFSNDSYMAAVWDSDHLALYMLHNDGESTEYGYGSGIRLTMIAEVELKPLVDDALANVLWSADSSTLTWEDGTGIWHWNIIDAAEPTRLLTSAAMQTHELSSPALMDISQYGRYVRLSTPDGWLLLDATTGTTYANTLISPNEQFLIYPSSTSPELVPSTCVPPLRETCAVYNEEEGIDAVFAYQLNLIGTASCYEQDERCRINIQSAQPALHLTNYIRGNVVYLRQLIFDPQYEQFVVLFGDYQVHFGLYLPGDLADPQYRPYLDIVDLEDTIDAPIASIEWGQPVFYDQYHLTTNMYLPK